VSAHFGSQQSLTKQEEKMTKTKAQIVREHPRYFSKANNKFFGSKIEYVGVADVNGDDWFVTSEYDKYGATGYKRLFSVRRANANKPSEVETVGKFCGYDNLHDAITALTKSVVEVAVTQIIGGVPQ
jgi:hypothetical protein